MEKQEHQLQHYQSDWKRFVELDGDEANPIKLYDDEYEELNQQMANQLQLQEHTLAEFTLFDMGTAVDILHFLGSPSMQIFDKSELSSLVSYFLPNDLQNLMLDNANLLLYQVVSKEATNNVEQFYNKKKFKVQEVLQCFGMNLLFAIYQFPQLEDYWRAEPWLLGGIETCLAEGRFKFLNSNLLVHIPLETQEQANNLITALKQKVRRIFRPDQELIVYTRDYKSYSVLYLLCYDTRVIVDHIIYIKQYSDQQLLSLINPYINQNHVIYFAVPVSQNIVTYLTDQMTYPVVEMSINPQFQHLQGGQYCYKQVLLYKTDSTLYVCPKDQMISGFSYKERLQGIQQVIKEANIQMYSPFYLGQGESEQIELRVQFEEYFEIVVYNSFIFSQRQQYKEFRVDFANSMLGDKLQQIQRDRRDGKKRQMAQITHECYNTDGLSFGLNPTYAEAYHTPFPQSGNDTFKYCYVCMKFDGLTKPYFRCVQCEKLIGQFRIFLCPYPCFELFHKNPSEFIQCNMDQMQKHGEGIYFNKDSNVFAEFVEKLNNEPQKSRRKNKNSKKEPNHFSFNKEIYKDEKQHEEITSNIKKPVMPSPALLQPVHGIQPAVPNQSGHHKDMEQINQKDRELKEQQQRDEQAFEDLMGLIMPKKLTKQQQQQQNQKNDNNDEDFQVKKGNKRQTKKKDQQQDNESNVSPFQQFMQQIKSKAKVEATEQQNSEND